VIVELGILAGMLGLWLLLLAIEVVARALKPPR
jgi:hypothetical protein